MQGLVELILGAGKSAVELTLYVLLPVMVLMMAVMRWLEVRGVLGFVARLLAPVLKPFGVPGVGVFAVLQMLFVGYAAPVATLAVMERDGTARRKIGATLGMVLAMSQANAVFPLLAVGLSLPWVLVSSLAGGLAAAAVTSHLLRTENVEEPPVEKAGDRPAARRVGGLSLLIEGGQDGVQLCLKSIPILVLTLFLVKALAATGAIRWLEAALTPVLEGAGFSGLVVLPFATKYLAGGTAMLGVTMDFVQSGAMSAVDLNRIAGFMVNPLDLVGISVLASAGPRVAAVVRPAVVGAVVGILIRGVLHLILF